MVYLLLVMLGKVTKGSECEKEIHFACLPSVMVTLHSCSQLSGSSQRAKHPSSIGWRITLSLTTPTGLISAAKDTRQHEQQTCHPKIPSGTQRAGGGREAFRSTAAMSTNCIVLHSVSFCSGGTGGWSRVREPFETWTLNVCVFTFNYRNAIILKADDVFQFVYFN